MITKIKQLKNTLKEKGIKPTYPRIKILEYLEDNWTHPSADMIYKIMVKEIPTASKTTVYNTLEIFQKKGLVSNITITGRETRFDRNISPHSHFFCERCGKIIDLDIKCPFFQKGEVSGHKINKLHGCFKGICSDCLKEERERINKSPPRKNFENHKK